MEDDSRSILLDKLERLFQFFDETPCVVAFSGGVDSATLAKALVLSSARSSSGKARKSVFRRAVGILAESPTLTLKERVDARRIANEIGIALRTFQSAEFDDPRFTENSPERCYWCKKTRFAAMREIVAREYGADVALVDGSNADDKGDFRPGTRAARETGVRSPFAELDFAKSEIRELARTWGLSVADKPSNPCLATRVSYRLELEVDLLRQIERAESFVRNCGFPICRVRVDQKDCARIEAPEADLEKLARVETRRAIVAGLKDVGFKFVSLDLEGFYSGKNNQALSPALISQK